MSQTLGEKLRQAREARGASISDIAEQTRISALYLSCIENDDFRTLPGGIFNKGFVKSFAKTVGVDEQEALQDYAQLISDQGSTVGDDPKTYRPEVLTDDNSSSSNLPTILFAVVILILMTAGILFLVNYLQRSPAQPVVNTNTGANSNAVNTVSNVLPANSAVSSAPSMNDLKIEFKAIKSPVSVASTADGKKSYALITSEKPLLFQPKQSLRLSYAKAQSQNVQMTINGKQINLPAAAENPSRNVIEIEINNEKLARIWESGQISSNTPTAPR